MKALKAWKYQTVLALLLSFDSMMGGWGERKETATRGTD